MIRFMHLEAFFKHAYYVKVCLIRINGVTLYIGSLYIILYYILYVSIVSLNSMLTQCTHSGLLPDPCGVVLNNVALLTLVVLCRLYAGLEMVNGC